jgi:hypothetical protein
VVAAKPHQERVEAKTTVETQKLLPEGRNR